MWKRHVVAIAAALALLGQHSASAQPSTSANDTMPGCRAFITDSMRNLLEQGVCAGIIQAMFYFGRTRLDVCFPDGVKLAQAVRVVIRYIDQRPERMHERFEALALEALQQAWPCRR